jgi:hypothetical protein
MLATKFNSTVLSLDYMLLNTPEVILTFDQPTVKYLTDHLRTFPMAFVRNGSTLFIHRQLYQDGLPDPLQDIFALCAMDIHHSQANQHIISRAISSSASHLIQSIPSTHTFISKLAFVQSLILLQIMTLYSPTVDQALRQQAERRMPLLKVWAVKLYQSAPSYLPASMSPRQAWILAESCRRTIHLCHMVSGLYSMLKFGCFALTLFVEALPLNRNGHLWDDNLYFNQTAPETDLSFPRLNEADLISYRELTDLWEEGQFRQPGLFEEMLLAACKGIGNVNRGAQAADSQQVSVHQP